MKKILGGCLAMVGVVGASKLVYDHYLENKHETEWYWLAIPVVCFLVGVKMLASRD